METALKERIVKLLEAVVGGSAQDNIPVVKQFEQEKMEAIEWLYPVEQDDLHGDRIDLDEARNMVEGINKSLKEGKLAVALNHKAKLTSVEITKAWINEHECMIGDTLVPEGWPLCKMKFHSKELWAKRKSGEILGLSIGAMGTREEVEVEDE